MADSTPIAPVQGIHHVRITVTDIARSKDFYSNLFGREPQIDATEHHGEPGAAEDPQRFYGGCIFAVEGQLFGLRPVAAPGDRFDSTRVGLDHVSFSVATKAELTAAAERLDAAGIVNGGVTSLTGFGMSILSFQDPDDINLELLAPEE
ncbi:VOC family protein [Nocardioides rubriscoriae]|uniref:VOC family protein n=1 Tax=Nocardioides rubriscoriae TaxID=642762 RepID=UPI0011DF9DD9|nr:VOC family protein [Nocardioides rubriscoriae]